MVRGKFKVTEHREFDWDKVGKTVILAAVTDGPHATDDDRMFNEFTPSGRIEMHVNNPKALAQLPIGRKFYVDFTEAE